ncbi:uncharacterized protein LOC112574770 isoform X2 [Pomacea canaliculata]|uniref:uncharacterized protein LOC112574770 isoform X2 n=1 Tax=Pomacea canaliculata TaxID=400727 RepID=UPI000D73E122|nr:uncharacterized protein LOC112574770 isoform X2 [Pomacea canaliculata]
MADTEVLTTQQGLPEREERYRYLDQLNRALSEIKSKDRGEIEEKKKEILAFCKQEMEKTICNQDHQEIGDWLNKIAETGVNREAREKAWFKYAQEVYWDLEKSNSNNNKKKSHISGRRLPKWEELITRISQMIKDKKLWEPKVGYPPLCPPKTLKEDLLRDVDFTEVDKDARAKLNSPKDSFDKLVQHLTSHLSSDLHKLRAIFVWMGAQKIGFRQQESNCKDKNSPEYYLQEASKNSRLIDIMFARMCRAARIPCVLVNGKAKGTNYEPGNVDSEGEYTWAVVYVADSWRFVFSLAAFVAVHGYQSEHLFLVEESGEQIIARLPANVGTKMSSFDEFYFLTDPEVMNYFCHPYDEDKQLVTEPWTEEEFFDSPFFSKSYFSSAWKLISPWTCVIKTTTGWCLIDMFNPGPGYKLKYRLFSGEIVETDRCVTILKRTQQRESFLVRLPETGKYKFEVLEVHGVGEISLVTFQIVYDDASSKTRPLPSNPENGFGFGEAAAEAGLSEPSHTEGVVPVKSGDEISIHFKVKDDVDISARLVHFSRESEKLRDNITVNRENKNVTIIARLPADDPKPEYSLEVDTSKNIKGTDYSIKELPALNYLLTSDETLSTVITDKDRKEHLQHYEDAWVSVGNDDAGILEKAASMLKMAGINDPILTQKIRNKQTCYKNMLEEMLTSARERNLDRLNKDLKTCIAANLQNRGDIENSKKVLIALCEEEMEKAVKGNKLEELRECIKKIENTCVGAVVQEQAWFKEVQKDIKRRTLSVREQDEANVRRPPGHVMDVIVAAFILIGEKEENLDSWQKVVARLKETNEKELQKKVNSYTTDYLNQQRVNLAKKKLDRAEGTFADYRSIETLKKQCWDKIRSYETVGRLKKTTNAVEMKNINCPARGCNISLILMKK